MIKLEDAASLDFSNMGLFIGEAGWIHPQATNKTHELVYVVKGTVYIEEDGARYALAPGELFCLRSGITHRGYRASDGVSFFWLHFFAEHYERYGVRHQKVCDPHACITLLKNLNHLAKIGADRALIESRLLAFLLEIKHTPTKENKLFHEVSEYVRTHIDKPLGVRSIAQAFGYNPDYLSRLFVQNSGLSLKQYLDRLRISLICDALLTTTDTLKEIAARCGFEDANAMIKFFGARMGTSPTRYRNAIFATHTNLR